ncbi:7SK snRNA methylphosphate capping enzyme [Thalictrum thalictroides]|uniref:RNA methyltransferase n=1 Tax=Thalictrum thalictroides TaxID=46969 RepID=A0A7J6VKG1_THATH|nr:7SK snRNA methylphosphate capping enzyme [Thalictrum thalictroides]
METKGEKPQESSKKRKRKEVAIFGNYRHYYGYRITKDMNQDPRFKVFKKEWFEDKDCLDIGCNQGLITIEIAKSFCCRSIIGIDIDYSLIESACWNLKRLSKNDTAISSPSNASESVLSDRANDLLEHSVPVSLNNDTEIVRNNLLDRVTFRKENIVEKVCRDTEKYDTILCLSVTKWIHLNWGDDGLITLFANIWQLLRPGGILIVEPQPWKSYKKNYLVSEMMSSLSDILMTSVQVFHVLQTATLNYNNILIPPCLFQEILIDKIGFRTVENITSNIPGSVIGFDRPIFLFRK